MDALKALQTGMAVLLGARKEPRDKLPRVLREPPDGGGADTGKSATPPVMYTSHL